MTRFSPFILALVASASASQLMGRAVSTDSDNAAKSQFLPEFTSASGNSCVEAFGQGYHTCREGTESHPRICFNPDLGDSCCSNKWACPRGSYCMPDSDLCCPAGLTIEECREGGEHQPKTSSTLTPTGTGTAAPTGTGAPNGNGNGNGTNSNLPEGSGFSVRPPLFLSTSIAVTIAGLALAAFV